MILIGLGANIAGQYGSPEQALRAACSTLSSCGLELLAVSRVWLSAPVPISAQPWYHNAVISVETALSSGDLLCLLKNVEKDFGRIQAVRNAPRVLDLDILSYHDDVSVCADLMIPHPRMHERAFVLYPLRDVAPNWVHPILNLSVDALIENLPPEQEISLLQKGGVNVICI